MKLRPKYGQGLVAQGYWQGSKTGGGSLRRQDWETLGTAAAELGASGLRWEGKE